MSSKFPSAFPCLFLLCFLLLYLYSTSFLPYSSTSTMTSSSSSPCNLFKGHWVLDPKPSKPFYNESCPFHRNAWNCLRNKRENIGIINSWKWVPKNFDLPRIDPEWFFALMRNRNIGFIGDSLNENFLVSFLCILRVADADTKRWKKKGAWKGAYFPNFNVTVAYHRAVLLAKYEWQPKQDGLKGTYRVDVDVPVDSWATIIDFYDVLIYNTGHCIAENLLSKLGSLAFQEIGLIYGFKNDLKELQNSFSTINAVLLDAEEQQEHSHAVENWIRKLKEIVYEADELLDEVATEDLWRKVRVQGKIARKF